MESNADIAYIPYDNNLPNDVRTSFLQFSCNKGNQGDKPRFVNCRVSNLCTNMLRNTSVHAAEGTAPTE